MTKKKKDDRRCYQVLLPVWIHVKAEGREEATSIAQDILYKIPNVIEVGGAEEVEDITSE